MNLPSIVRASVAGAAQIKIKLNGKGMGELSLINMLPVLEKNHDWSEHVKKLKEETDEMKDAIGILDFIQNGKLFYPKSEEEAADQLLEETLNVIQIAIGVIEKVSETHPKLVKEAIPKHIEKLNSRGWKFRKWLRIEED